MQASLANNPSSRPIFRKESRKKGIWGLARRATEYLQQKGYSIEHFCSKSGGDQDTDAEEGEGSSDDSPAPEDPEVDDQEEGEFLSEHHDSMDESEAVKEEAANESEDAADSDDGDKAGRFSTKMKEEEIRVDTSCSLQSLAEEDRGVLGKRNKPLLQVPPTKRIADP